MKLTPVFVTRAAADSHVDARHQGPPLKLTPGSARSRVRGLVEVRSVKLTIVFVTRAAPPADDRGRRRFPRRCSSPGGRRLKLTPVLGPVEGPGRETDARVRHQGRRPPIGSACCRRCSSLGQRRRLTIVLGLVEGPEREADARPGPCSSPRGRRLKLTIGSARVRHHGGHRLKLTIVFGLVEVRSVKLTPGSAVFVTRSAPPAEADARARPGRGPGPEADARARHHGGRAAG